MNMPIYSENRAYEIKINGIAILLYFFFFLFLFSTELSSATISSELPAELPDPPQTASAVIAKKHERITNHLQTKLASQTADQLNAVIVMLKVPERATAFQKIAGPFQVKHDFSIFNGFAAKMTKAQIMALSKNPNVFNIQEDAQVKAYIADAKADYGINAASSLASPALSGAGVDICVIDTGVSITHQQTNQHVFAFCDATSSPAGCDVDASGNAITSGEPAAYDDNGHGTAVVSAAAGDGQPNATNAGVAPSAGVAAAKVLNSGGSGSASQVIKGVEWCAGLSSVRVLNLSLGENEHNANTDALTFSVNCVSDPTWSVGSMTCSSPSRPAKVVVAAAGNSGPAQYQIFSPGEAEKVITVGATYNKTEGGNALAAFSSRGPTLNNQIKPDVVAPGANVFTANSGTVNGYSARFGTSFSAPIVTGVAALMLEADPFLTPSELKSILQVTAQHWGPPGKNIDWGSGQMDAYAAIRQVLGLPSEAWGFPGHNYLTGHLDPYGAVPSTFDNEDEWLYPFELNNSNLPIAATMVIGGAWTCSWQNIVFFGWDCISTARGPELDMQLIGPSGAIIDTSACPIPLSSDPTCGFTGWGDPFFYGTAGRQEMHIILPPGGGFGAGTYTLRIYRSIDPLGNYDDSLQADFFVELQNASPVSSNIPPTVTANNDSFNEGTSKVYSADWTDADGAGQIHTCTINFGDGGGAQTGTISPTQTSSSGTCSLAHTYADGPNSYTINVTVNDGVANGTNSGTATVNNVNPQISLVTNDGPKEINQAVTVTVSASDAAGASDPLGYAFDCDNNSSYEIGPQSSSSAACTYTITGSKTVNVRVTDGDGGSSTSSASFNITNGSSATIHIADLDGVKNSAGKNKWNAVVTVKLNPAVSGANVSGNWSTGAVSSCSTISGACSMTLSNLSNNGVPNVTFSVSGISAPGYTYNPAANTEPDDDSNGTVITVPTPDPPPPSPGEEASVTESGTTTPLRGNKWRVDITLTASASINGPIVGSTIAGSWSTGGSSSCTTNSSGSCIVSKNNIASSVLTITYTVTDVSGYSLPSTALSFTYNKP